MPGRTSTPFASKVAVTSKVVMPDRTVAEGELGGALVVALLSLRLRLLQGVLGRTDALPLRRLEADLARGELCCRLVARLPCRGLRLRQRGLRALHRDRCGDLCVLEGGLVV